MVAAGANSPSSRPWEPMSLPPTARTTRHEPRTMYRPRRNQPGVGRGTTIVWKTSQKTSTSSSRPSGEFDDLHRCLSSANRSDGDALPTRRAGNEKRDRHE